MSNLFYCSCQHDEKAHIGYNELEFLRVTVGKFDIQTCTDCSKCQGLSETALVALRARALNNG